MGGYNISTLCTKQTNITSVKNLLIMKTFIFSLDVSNIRPVYGPKDFLEVLINIAMPSRNEELLNQGWGLLTVPIHVRSLNELVSVRSLSPDSPAGSAVDKV